MRRTLEEQRHPGWDRERESEARENSEDIPKGSPTIEAETVANSSISPTKQRTICGSLQDTRRRKEV